MKVIQWMADLLLNLDSRVSLKHWGDCLASYGLYNMVSVEQKVGTVELSHITYTWALGYPKGVSG